MAEVVADYDAKSADELTVRVGETVEITDKEKDSSGWWKVNKMVLHTYEATVGVCGKSGNGRQIGKCDYI